MTLDWDGPSSQVTDVFAGTTTTVHRYQVQMKASLNDSKWTSVGGITTDRTMTVPDVGQAFYRINLVP